MTNFFDHNAERHVIGAILNGRNVSLEESDFHLVLNQQIWSTAQMLASKGKAVTMETVAAEMEKPDVLYLTDCVVLSSLAADQYADRVKELAEKRRIMSVLEKAARGLNDGKSPMEIVADLQSDSLKSIRQIGGASKSDISALMDEFLDAYADPRDVWGIRTGIGGIDIELGGVHKGEVLLVAGDPGVGKSIFVSQLGYQMAGVRFWPNQIVENRPGAMYHLEMKEGAIVRRAACALAHVRSHDVRRGKVSEAENEKYLSSLDLLSKIPVFVSDRTDWNTTSLRSDVARLMIEHNIEWVIVDYAGLLKDEADSEISREIRISQALHDIAKMGVAMIVVETLNKEGLKGLRSIAGVRGSVQKVYDADVVAMLQIPKGNDKSGSTDARELMFTKAREADKFLKIPLRLVGPQKRIEPWEQPVLF